MSSNQDLVKNFPDYVGQREACRISGRSASWLLRITATGRIRTLMEPGISIRYHREDVMTLSPLNKPVSAA